MAQSKRPRSLTLGKSISTAAKASLPVVAGAGGGLAGTLAARYALAKARPESYASSTVLPVVAGSVGAIVGGALPIALLVSTKTKSAAEKAYKATIPLGAIGVIAVLLGTTLVPKLWAWLRAKMPGATLTATVSDTAKQLTAATVAASSAAKQLTSGSGGASGVAPAAGRELALARSGGLTPRQRARLEARAAGLRPSQRDALERVTGGSVRYAV